MKLFQRSDKIRKDYLIRKLNKLRPNQHQVRKSPLYWQGCDDTINKVIEIINKSKS